MGYGKSSGPDQRQDRALAVRSAGTVEVSERVTHLSYDDEIPLSVDELRSHYCGSLAGL
jgi:hypothetical protein